MTALVLTSGTAWIVPADWNSASNYVVCIGAGGSTSSSGYGGGGGGACAYTINMVLEPGALVPIQIGAGGGTTGSGFGPTANTWFYTVASYVLAAGGASTTGGNTGGAAGSTA